MSASRAGERSSRPVEVEPVLSSSSVERRASVHEAKTHLSCLLNDVMAGQTVIITRRGEAVAKLEPIVRRPKRVFGSMKGIISIDDRFFDPLPEDELRAWEGA